MSDNELEKVLAGVRARRGLPAPMARRALREAAGLSQAHVAKVLGVGHWEVSRYEGGSRAPRGDRAVAYAQLLSRLADEVRA